ncbi:class I SAM-dependent methyltransferase [uncultured Celeribacter sp.]|uniref:class I SAM-dependent methyltransferase n=1 Tax=uncultured Celeribacter sp. TaxID=1303376 RepID=UPI0037496F10
MTPATAHIQRKLDALAQPVSLVLPSGTLLGERTAPIQLKLQSSRDLAALAAGQLGTIGEAVVEGRAVVEGSMRDIMAAVVGLLPSQNIGAPPSWWHRGLARISSRLHHSRRRDAAQIAFHYDVSDDFYALWLDPRRVYSCAYYPSASTQLDKAQEAKLDLICRKLDLQREERFLDIGAGWGGLLLWAAENYGVEAQGITLSRNQHAYVNRLIAEKGLAHRVRMDLLDYRDLGSQRPFDKIASVGMFEHVGTANMPTYFGTLHRLLRPGGLLLNHGITSSGLDGAQIGGGLGDFIERYIFPGGELVHVSAAVREVSTAGLEPVDVENLRPHYARTLWDWSDALEARLPEAERVLTETAGPDRGPAILRAYRLYLAGCALAFEKNWISIHQILATRPSGDPDHTELRGSQSDYPFRRDFIYTNSEGAA